MISLRIWFLTVSDDVMIYVTNFQLNLAMVIVVCPVHAMLAYALSFGITFKVLYILGSLYLVELWELQGEKAVQ